VVDVGRCWLLALVLAACEASSAGIDGGGADGGVPRRECLTRFSLKTSGKTVGVAGEWNQFDPAKTPMSADAGGIFRASVSLPVGSYGYKLVVDGTFQLDPTNPYSKYVGGVENSVVEVDDCQNPELQFVSLEKSADGHAHLVAQYVDGAGGSGLDQVTVTLDGAEVASTVEGGVITVEEAGLAKDKHRLTVGARDRAGHAAKTLQVPFWIEDQPFDFRDGVLYFAFTDRFRNGDPANDQPVPNVDGRANYFGGDFAGIRAALDEGYFDGLGVRSLWVSPPMPNPDHGELGSDGRQYSGYHGYWPTASSATQTRFGSVDDFRLLVKTAHAHGIRVIVDVVLNHVHKEHPLYQAHASDGWFNGDGSCVCGGNNCDWDSHALDCWFTNYLPDLNYQNFDAMKAMIDDALFWAVDLDVDGFRVDAVKHFYHAATRRLRSKLHDDLEHAATLYYLVGETFDGDRGLINSFIGPSELSAQFDFPLYFAVRDTIGGGGTLRNLEAAAVASDQTFGSAPMSPFAGNHDVPRFLTQAAGMVVGDGKDQAWNNPPGAPPADAYFRLRLALAYVLTQPGVPLLYYGDEVGMPGAADPDNRRPMKWSGYSGDEQATLELIQKVGKARVELPALQRGNRVTLWVDDDLYIYARVMGSFVAVVGINRSGNARSESVPVRVETPIPDGTQLRDRLGGPNVVAAAGHLPISIPPNSAVVLAP
jgi:glycosidase